MGGKQSNLNPPPRRFGHLCIAIRPSDKLRIIHGTDQEISTIRQIIEETWRKGIQREQYLFNGVHEFKLKGNPFQVRKSASWETAASILHRLHRDGWKLLISSNLTRTTDLTTWIFKKMPNTAVSTRPPLILSFCCSDTWVVLNIPGDLELHRMFRDVLGKSWPVCIEKWSPTSNTSNLTIKLRRYSGDQDTALTKRLLPNLIRELYLRKWNLYGNSNLDAPFFEYEPNVIPIEPFKAHLISTLNKQPRKPSTAHLTITRNKQDRLHLIGASDSLVSVVRNVIPPSLIDAETRYAQSWDLKLSVSPCFASDWTTSSRLTTIRLLEALHSNGWSIISSIDSSEKWSDKTSFVFRESQPIQSSVFCLSLTGSNKLQLINAPRDIVDIFRQVVEAQWMLGVRKMNGDPDEDSSEMDLELKGNPWNFGKGGRDSVHGRSLLCHLFEAFAIYQWRPITSACIAVKHANQEDGLDYPRDVHSIFFTKDATATEPSQATGCQASPLQTTGDRMRQNIFARHGEPPLSYRSLHETLLYGTVT